MQQAARDLVLVLKEEIVKLFSQALKAKVSQELNPEFLKELILKVAENWSKNKETSLDLQMADKDKKKLETLLFNELGKKAEGRIEIKVGKAIDKGFRINIKGKELYYDFTDESIAESLKEFLNPAISKMLNTK